jgi:glycerate 2-kinase
VRKHLSAVKGGRLAAAAHPVRVLTYLISDVPGDDPAVIASGPTVPDPTTFGEALEILRRYDLEAPPRVLEHLRAGAAQAGGGDGAAAAPGASTETPKPGDPSFAHDEVIVLATAADALAAAARRAEAAGVRPVVLGDDLQGEARDLAAAHAALALTYARGVHPVVLLSGGETTVTVRGGGSGGRNSEYLLALAVALGGRPGISAIACDTDGVDGVEDAAGALVTPDTLARAELAGVEPAAALAGNDSFSFFSALGDLVVTGPTGTNVNDFRAILVE